jgi:hypothetical protein
LAGMEVKETLMGWLGLVIVLCFGFIAIDDAIRQSGDKIVTACTQVAK